ncbi:MFS transporter [Deltaproteobacteria bacterium Smac51]|nr:MFS transporter [Deltaproteobacteria bacterium Smac51]
MKIYVWFPMLVSLGLGFIFMNIPPLGQQFMDMLGVSYGGLSFLLSGLFWSHAFGQLPAGLIADRFSPWTTLMAGLAICLAANVAPFIDPHSLALATAMRFFLGAGTSLSFLATMKVMHILAPSEKITSIQGLQGAAFSLGFMLPYAVLPHLGDQAWPYAYLIAVALMALCMAAAFLLPRDRLAPSGSPKSRTEIWRAVKDICTAKPIWALGIFHGLSYGSLNNLGNWLPSILADLGGLGDPAAWSLAAMILLLLGALGRAFGGSLLLSRFTRSAAVNGAVLLICALYIVMGLAGQKYMVIGSAFLMALACGSTYGGIFTLSAGAAGAAYAATAMGVMNMIGNLFNVALTLVFGFVREFTGHFSLSLLAAGTVGVLCWILGRKVVTGLDRRLRPEP